MNKYEARKKFVEERINEVLVYLDKGFLIWLIDRHTDDMIAINKKDIQMGSKNKQPWELVIGTWQLYNHDPEYDDGYYTSIKELDKRLTFKIIDPKHIVTLGK